MHDENNKATCDGGLVLGVNVSPLRYFPGEVHDSNFCVCKTAKLIDLSDCPWVDQLRVLFLGLEVKDLFSSPDFSTILDKIPHFSGPQFPFPQTEELRLSDFNSIFHYPRFYHSALNNYITEYSFSNSQIFSHPIKTKYLDKLPHF